MGRRIIHDGGLFSRFPAAVGPSRVRAFALSQKPAAQRRSEAPPGHIATWVPLDLILRQERTGYGQSEGKTSLLLWKHGHALNELNGYCCRWTLRKGFHKHSNSTEEYQCESLLASQPNSPFLEMIINTLEAGCCRLPGGWDYSISVANLILLQLFQPVK